MADEQQIERYLSKDFIRVAEAAAIACGRDKGRGDRNHADHLAVEAMRDELNKMPIDGRIVIGEGERDEAPMLYIGERLGEFAGKDDARFNVDIAVDPLEGTNLCATGSNGAIAVLAVSERGGLFHAPDTYMEKLVVGPPSRGKVSLDNTVRENLEIIADSKQRSVQDLNIVILERPRHKDLIAQVRDAGARIKLISDGDLSAGVSTSISGAGIDAVMGTGGAPEGVLTAAAMKCLGGEILGRFVWKDEAEKQRARAMGIQNLDRTYTTDELVPGRDVLFIATAVTDGDFFKGVRYLGNAIRTETLLLAHRSRLVRFIHSHHIRATQNWGVPLI